MTEKIRWIDISIYPVKLAYIPNKKLWDKEIKSREWEGCPYPKSSGHCMYVTDKGQGYIFFAFNRMDEYTEIECEGLIAHEVTHAVDFIFEHIGEKTPGMESRAYLTQRLYMEIRGFIKLEP